MDSRGLFCLVIAAGVLIAESIATCSYPATLNSKQYALTRNKTSYATDETFEIACMPHFPTSDPTIITCQAAGSWNSTGPSCSKFGVAPWWALFVGVVGGIILISCTIPRLYVCLCGHKEDHMKIHPHEVVTADGVVILNPADPQHMAVYHGALTTRKGVPPSAAQAMLLTGATANVVYPAEQAKGAAVNAVYPIVQANGTVLMIPVPAMAEIDPGIYQKPVLVNRDKDLRRRQHMAFFRDNNRQPTDDDIIIATEKAVGNLYF